MTSPSITFSISVCVSIIAIGYSTAALKCGPNESVDDCPRNCSSEYCPTNRFQDQKPCPKPKICPSPACVCNFNYRRAKNNTCIPTEQCPPFPCKGLNEKYDPCPSYCPGDQCSNANPTGECPFQILIVVECSPACRCIPHYWRNNGTCVPYLECPGVIEELAKKDNGSTDVLIK